MDPKRLLLDWLLWLWEQGFTLCSVDLEAEIKRDQAEHLMDEFLGSQDTTVALQAGVSKSE